MPKDTTARKVFDAAIQMAEGAKITIEFGNESQRSSFRVQFYNEKKRYSQQFSDIDSETLTCVKYNSPNNKLFLIIERVKSMSAPVIINPDGSITAIDLNKESETKSPFPELPENPETTNLGSGSETAEARRARLMRSEGINSNED